MGWVMASWWQRKAEASYGIAEEDLTPWRPWSLQALRKVFNEVKHTDPRFAGWWEENSKEAYNTGLANAAAAFDNYAQSKRGQRKGKRVGMPRRKSKHKDVEVKWGAHPAGEDRSVPGYRVDPPVRR
ncbi:hypothetical protein ABZ671_25775 [Micromonospora sp. NPDC006766]|uniref:hypothetical protein n=1 Tax=Micromonospora sp. NPDC006766 TaxID=3154778 RepID=UPI0033FF11F9